jgi:hypothetical protein
LAGLGACVFTGCVGEGVVAYRGTVTAASVAGHSFDAAPNPANAPPIQGARVFVRITGAKERCGEAHVSASVLTDPQGTFDLPNGVFNGSPFVEHTVLVCVDHRDYENYEYRTIYGKSKDPQQGQQYLNITLKKK